MGGEPDDRPLAFVLFDRGGGLLDQLLLLPRAQIGLALGVGTAMPDDLIAALAEARHHLRAIVAERRVHHERERQLVVLGQPAPPPSADPDSENAPPPT